ncbi:hypothetical protein [Arthrobacter alpinus]|uniref:hypothetical protein n=1 Tax=Arthrobacter alpinus TaxID=656366 RepID=UPI001114A3AB|nr:hypothetical protein [Arthrobacter alpinus]
MVVPSKWNSTLASFLSMLVALNDPASRVYYVLKRAEETRRNQTLVTSDQRCSNVQLGILFDVTFCEMPAQGRPHPR